MKVAFIGLKGHVGTVLSGAKFLGDVEVVAVAEEDAALMASLMKKDLLALYNDHSGRFPFSKGKRTPLVAAISSDGGKTWPVRKLIEGDPDGWYCYSAIHFVGDSVLLGHCAGDSKLGTYLGTLPIRRISLDWLRQP